MSMSLSLLLSLLLMLMSLLMLIKSLCIEMKENKQDGIKRHKKADRVVLDETMDLIAAYLKMYQDVQLWIHPACAGRHAKINNCDDDNNNDEDNHDGDDTDKEVNYHKDIHEDSNENLVLKMKRTAQTTVKTSAQWRWPCIQWWQRQRNRRNRLASTGWAWMTLSSLCSLF